jgi:pimeloyl-ACP methyl ester carboxylesterase
MLRHRLAETLDAPVRQFRYASVSTGFNEVVDALLRFAASRPAERVHLVGYSLGGLVTLAALARGGLPPGRAVLLGSPVRGSRAALGAARLPLGPRLVGACLPEAMEAGPWCLPADREVGVIAGNLSLGMGRLVARFEGDNDGTVAVEETHVEGAPRLVLPVSHTGLLFSTQVAAAAAGFLRSGRFRVAEQLA